MKKMFIHAGMPKTGTATLQAFMAKNCHTLKDMGIYYPKPINIMGWDQHVELWPGYFKEFDPQHKTPYNIIDYYKKSFSSTSCHTICLSSELFIFSSINDYRDITKEYDTKYIIYIRNPLLHAQSRIIFDSCYYLFSPFYEECRLFNTNTYNEDIAYQIKFLNQFSQENFNKDTFILKSYDICSANGNLINSFCEILGINSLDNFQQGNNENVSLSLDYAFFFAHLALVPLLLTNKRNIFKELQQLSALEQTKYRIFSKKQLSAIPKSIIKQYEMLGKNIGDPDLWQRGMDQLLQMEECPYRQLPADKQEEIFAKLSPESQESILKAWTPRSSYPGILHYSGILPDLPEDEQTAYLLRQWMMKFNQLEMDKKIHYV